MGRNWRSRIMMVHWYWKQIFQYGMLHILISLKFTSKNCSSKYQSGNNTQFFFFCGVKNRTWSHQKIQLHELRLKIHRFSITGQHIFHHNKHMLWRDFDTARRRDSTELLHLWDWIHLGAWQNCYGLLWLPKKIQKRLIVLSFYLQIFMACTYMFYILPSV